MRIITVNCVSYLLLLLFCILSPVYCKENADQCPYTVKDNNGQTQQYSYIPFGCYMILDCKSCSFQQAKAICRDNNAAIARMSPHDTFGPLFFDIFGTKSKSYVPEEQAWVKPTSNGCRSFILSNNENSTSFQQLTDCNARLKFALCMRQPKHRRLLSH